MAEGRLEHLLGLRGSLRRSAFVCNRQRARNPSINPCFWMERSVGTLNWFTTMLGWQVNQTGRVAIKNIEVERKKSKRRQESHFARRLVSRGLGFLDRWCS